MAGGTSDTSVRGVEERINDAWSDLKSSWDNPSVDAQTEQRIQEAIAERMGELGYIMAMGRGKNRLPGTGEPGSRVWNDPGTKGREYGPDGKPKQDWNNGHPGHKPPEDEDHVHDHDPTAPRGKNVKQVDRPLQKKEKNGIKVMTLDQLLMNLRDYTMNSGIIIKHQRLLSVRGLLSI
ncbi:MAG: hypothetical protein HC894_31435 [Microcoleus sp. SM1_3_4]|nr:hypothetical protein [Microcoleus sp. SM1_3_4]